MSDFNINNYSDEELYELVDLKKGASPDEIREKTNEYIEKYINEEGDGLQFYNFFIEVQERLLEEEEEDAGGDFIKTEYHPNPTNTKQLPNRLDSTVIVNDEHAVLRRERLKVRQGHSIPYVQGQMNPTLQNVKKQLINIDSHYRELHQCLSTQTDDCSGTLCSTKTISLADSPTDFTFNLSQPIHHVLKMSVYSYEIPHSWYVFSPDYGTTTFGVSGECVDISGGNYDPSGLVDAIGAALPGGVSINYSSITNKVSFDGGGTNFPLVFYDASGTHFDCSAAPCGGLPGGKLDYNLGWLLGFRQPSYSGSSSYTGESLIDTYGFRYLFLEINDFHNNRLNQNVISMDANRSTFSYPASKRCALPAADPSSNIILQSSSSCGKPPPPWTGPPLTASEVYTRAQIELAQQEGFPDRYLSPVNSDIIARIPVRKTNNYDMLFDNWNNNLEDTAREYFGPVTLKRLHVRLLNDKGFPINLNGMDFSFSLIVKYLYQY